MFPALLSPVQLTSQLQPHSECECVSLFYIQLNWGGVGSPNMKFKQKKNKVGVCGFFILFF